MSTYIFKEQRINKLQEDQLDSVIKTNQSVIKTNTIITTTSITTLIFVIVAAITSILQYLKNDEIKIKLNDKQYKEILLLQATKSQSQKDIKRSFPLKDTSQH